MESVEGSRVVGYGVSHPNGGTLLTLRLDPEQAAKTTGWVYFEMGVPDTAALTQLGDRLDGLVIAHCPVARTPIGWLLPGAFDPDGHEMRFYVPEPHETVDPEHPMRSITPGPKAGANCSRASTSAPSPRGSQTSGTTGLLERRRSGWGVVPAVARRPGGCVTPACRSSALTVPMNERPTDRPAATPSVWSADARSCCPP
jgi:hypothetical protein